MYKASISVESSGKHEIPPLMVISVFRVSAEAALSEVTNLSQAVTAWTSLVSGRITENSSPPVRATVSSVRKDFCKIFPMRIRALSPSLCP